jgi:hypothetical protein
VNIMGYVQAILAPLGHNHPRRQLVSVRQHPVPSGSIQVMPASPGPTMKKQQSHHVPRRRSQVNKQPPRKETQPEFFSDHVAPTSHAHEQVTSTNTADQGRKEPPGHTTTSHK